MSAQVETNALARAAAEAAVRGMTVEPTSLVEYRSTGRTLIVGAGDVVDAVAYMLPAPLSATLLRLDDDAVEDDVSVPRAGRPLRIEGHLGAFRLHLGEAGNPGHQVLTADLVLDLSPTPLIDLPLKPPGYLHRSPEHDDLHQAAVELGELSGTFEKPRYFEYDASVCAHGRSGQPGCNRCVEACPAGAITSLVESIEVDPYRCQGGGVCATVCPTGAIRYALPRPKDLLERIRRQLKAYLDHGGRTPVIALVAEADRAGCARLADHVLVVELEELGSAGLDAWLSALAWGAHQVVLLEGPSCPDVVAAELARQVTLAGEILSFLGLPADAVVMAPGESPPDATPERPAALKRASYAGMNDKRNMLFAAVDALAAHLDTAGAVVELSPGAPFGQVRVDHDRCTLCMACTGVCPASALVAGGELPQLLFVEANCVQCGICTNACPEDAIALEARLNLDVDGRRRARVVNQQEPFHCIECGKSFATRAVIDRMLEKLSGHPMFTGERARRRLLKCDDCRVADVVQDDEAMGRPVQGN